MNKSGILLHIAGLWTLSTLDASGKWLVMAGIPVLMVTWFRYTVHIALMSAVVLPRRGKALFRTRSLSRQLVRGLLMIATTVLFFSGNRSPRRDSEERNMDRRVMSGPEKARCLVPIAPGLLV